MFGFPNAQQLTLEEMLSAQESTCTDCGETFQPFDHNPWTLCLDCIDRLESLADMRCEIVEKRDGMTADEKAQDVQDTKKRAEDITRSGYTLG